jgi:hypothetical protein
MGVGSDGRRSGLEQTLAMGIDEGAPMSLAEQVGLPDILIDPARGRGQVREGVVLPAVDGIILGEGDRPAEMLDDLHRDPAVGELLRLGLEVGRAPP